MLWVVFTIALAIWIVATLVCLSDLLDNESELFTKRINRLMHEFAHNPSSILFVIGILGIGIAVYFFYIFNGGRWEGSNHLLSIVSSNLSTEFFSLAFTVLIVDRLNARRLAQKEKEQIIRQLASRSNAFALEALRLIREYHWTVDGSLCKRIFDGASLEDADLSESLLFESRFINADLTNAKFLVSNLRRAKLWHAKLSGAQMFGVDLRGADLRGAEMIGADLTAAHLDDSLYPLKACLQNADLRKATLARAMLQGVDLRFAKLQRANLSGAMLMRADLSGAMLKDAILKGADLSDANLRQASLKGVDLRGVILERVELKGAFYDDFTQWDDKIDPQSAGAIFVGWENDGDS